MSVAQVWAKGGVWSAHPKMGSRIQRGSPLTLTPLRPRYPPQAGPPGHSASYQPRLRLGTRLRSAPAAHL